MRILHVLDHSIPLHSGYTFRTCAILEYQRALGWETFHLTSPKHAESSGLDIPYEEVDGLCFFRTKIPRGLLSRLPVLRQYAAIHALEIRLRALISDIKPDIIHAHSPALNGMASLRVAKQKGIPLVYEIRAFWEDAAVDHGTSSENGVRYHMTRGLENFVINRADAVTTICEGLRMDIIGRGINPEKVTVIPNAVDPSQFIVNDNKDADLLHKLKLEGKHVLGFIGSFYAYEGLGLLIEALPEILKKCANLTVLFVGGGPEEKALKQRVNELDLSENVIFTGRVPHSEVHEYYNLIDLFVYPRLSLRLTELVTPLKPLEAMAKGRLVLASDVGGHQELIHHGENGFLFKANDRNSLITAVLRLLEQRSAWHSVRSSGRKFIEEERSWASSVSRYRAVYESVMTKNL